MLRIQGTASIITMMRQRRMGKNPGRLGPLGMRGGKNTVPFPRDFFGLPKPSLGYEEWSIVMILIYRMGLAQGNLK